MSTSTSTHSRQSSASSTSFHSLPSVRKLPSTVIYTPPSPPSSGNSPSPSRPLSPSTSPPLGVSPRIEIEEIHRDPWIDLNPSGHHSKLAQVQVVFEAGPGMEDSLSGMEASWRTDKDDSTLRHRHATSSESTEYGGMGYPNDSHDQASSSKMSMWEPPIRLGEGSSGPLNIEPSRASLSRLRMYDTSGAGYMVPIPVPVPVNARSKGKGRLPTAVLAEMTATSNGRDKVLKCVQYSLRTYLYLLSIIARVRPLSRWFKANQKRMKMATSGLSLTRKCLLLTNSLHPLSALLSPEPMSASTMFMHLIDLLGAWSDDVYCLYKLGIVGKKTGKKADTWANRFWFLTTLMGLYKLHLKTVPSLKRRIMEVPSAVDDEKTVKELKDAKWTNRKLLADLIFVSYDIFDVGWFSEPVHCLTGLAAALISTSKVYDKHSRS